MNYEIYTKEQLETEETNEELMAKMKKGNELARMQLAARNHMLYGDIYVIHPYEQVADAKGHKFSCPESKAASITAMAQERVAQIEVEVTAQKAIQQQAEKQV